MRRPSMGKHMSKQTQVIIVTGGASGIGYAFAQDLARLGHKVVIADLDGAPLKQLCV